ncbi:MAG: ribonuclease HII [Chitinophagales bacterium]|jgi:ribonuclease HII|nr:ribonuclease HII [Chitinophagales bacterium]
MLSKYFEFPGYEIGVDEVGRGCLAGPVVAAAVWLPEDFEDEKIQDSKKIPKPERVRLASLIQENAIAYGIGICSELEIDEINILQASILAMHRAIDDLSLSSSISKVKLALIDGNKFKPYPNLAHKTIIKGDAKYLSIAAASIIAKVYRDKLMQDLDAEFPNYGWKKNCGYATKAHRDAIEKHGITPHHRRSFEPIKSLLSL